MVLVLFSVLVIIVPFQFGLVLMTLVLEYYILLVLLDLGNRLFG